MFEITKDGSSNKSVRMSNSLIERLEKIANEKEISFNKVVVQCCEYALSNMKDEENK